MDLKLIADAATIVGSLSIFLTLIFVGYELPIMLRAWATYFFDSNWDFDGGEKTEFTTIALGVGFTGLPFVSLNAEYRLNTFDSDEDIETNADILFSVSIKLTENISII